MQGQLRLVIYTPPSLSLAGTGAAAAHQLLRECGAGSAPALATGWAGWDTPATLIPWGWGIQGLPQPAALGTPEPVNT